MAIPNIRAIFNEKSTKTRKEQAIAILILVHTLYMLHGLLVSPPQNIFKALGFGLDVPPEYLRAKLAENFGGEQNVPPHLNTLLKRMGLSDLRSLYVRFGHHVLTTCSYCQSYDDFALYAFPAPLLEYIREIAFVGLLTLPKSSTAHFRPLGLGALLAALMTEAYWTLTTSIIIPTISSPNHNVTMHPSVPRSAPLPILGAFIPSPEAQHANLPPAQFQMQGQNPAIPANATLSQTSSMTMQTLQHLVPTLHLLNTRTRR
ncbi:hypothetical protein BDZ97DRAFT_93736 [Flammula alnicola]|nr:hypothetical protein BDZ97DRAFT_93736 [Flammula alnicola]